MSTSLPYDKLIHMHNFLESTSGGLSQDQMKSIHQNPLQFIRVDKETELVDMLQRDERFRGMMEVYSMFRELIAQERVSKDKTIRMGPLSE